MDTANIATKAKRTVTWTSLKFITSLYCHKKALEAAAVDKWSQKGRKTAVPEIIRPTEPERASGLR